MTVTVRQKKVGGKRKGAGRKPKASAKRSSIMVRMSEGTRAALDLVAAAAGATPSGWSHDAIVEAIRASADEGLITAEERDSLVRSEGEGT